MRKLTYLFSLLLLLGCDNAKEEHEMTVCPAPDPVVCVLTVDYTTNQFLGGYITDLPERKNALELRCEYKAPGDVGSVAWYDDLTETRLFAGTIVHMGTGKRTFPEEIPPLERFGKLESKREMPTMIPLSHDEYSVPEEDMDYTPIWDAVANLYCASWLREDTPAYIYLYQPSVGVGDPKEWYWLIFLRLL